MSSKKEEKNIWICDREEVVVHSPHIQIVKQDCHSSEDNRRHPFYILKSNDWCNIIPVTENGNLVLVRQYRIGVGKHTLEVPGGVVDAEDGDISLAAMRELKEETGYAPLPSAKCISLGSVQTNPALFNNKCHSFLIGPVRKSSNQNLDPGEMIDVVEVPIEEIPELILKEEINHALILMGFFFALLKGKDGAANLRAGLNEVLS